MNNSCDLTVDNDKTTTYIPSDSISIGYGAQKKYLKSEEEHDIIITKELKEKQFMSFVGFIKCKNGILTFGNTKGTRDKFYPEFENRDKIRKAFHIESIGLIQK